MTDFRRVAEEAIDREEQEKRDSKIARLQADLESKDQSRQFATRMGESRAAFAAEQSAEIREQLTSAFGEIAEQVVPLRPYRLLSLEGERRGILISDQDSFEALRLVAVGAGLSPDDWGAHLNMMPRDLPDTFDGKIIAVDPTPAEIRVIGAKQTA